MLNSLLGLLDRLLGLADFLRELLLGLVVEEDAAALDHADASEEKVDCGEAEYGCMLAYVVRV